MTPLPQASCAAGELICRRAGRGASSGPEKLRPEEAADGREPKAGGEGEEDQGSRRGRGCGAGMRCYQQVNNVWGVYNTSCPPGAPPELPSSTSQSLPAIIDCLWWLAATHRADRKTKSQTMVLLPSGKQGPTYRPTQQAVHKVLHSRRAPSLLPPCTLLRQSASERKPFRNRRF